VSTEKTTTAASPVRPFPSASVWVTSNLYRPSGRGAEVACPDATALAPWTWRSPAPRIRQLNRAPGRPLQVNVTLEEFVGPAGPPVSVGGLGAAGSTVKVRCRESRALPARSTARTNHSSLRPIGSGAAGVNAVAAAETDPARASDPPAVPVNTS
jgi:hypothetical protein